MNKIQLNLSGCYGEAGWHCSLLNTDSSNPTWTRIFGDIRADANVFLKKQNVEDDLYRLSNSTQGTAYSVVFPNKCDSRGGYLQISLFVVNGYRMEGDEILKVLATIKRNLPSDKETIALFAKDTVVMEKFQTKYNSILTESKVSLGSDMDIRFEMSEHPSLDLVARIYRNKAELIELLSYPHQEAYSDYRSIVLVDGTKYTSSRYIKSFPPISHIYVPKQRRKEPNFITRFIKKVISNFQKK